jgi:NAD(P)-dependent dehydrogenase (short-subunit alcohol dehydrogenase family)
MPSRSLHALVIGGSRGIGLSIAQLLARNNYSITLLSRSKPALEDALETLDGHTAGPVTPHLYIDADITASEFWSPSRFGTAYAATGNNHSTTRSRKIDVLVNCAGITQTSLFTRMEPDDIERVVQTNLTAMMVGTRYLLRNKLISGRGREEGVHSPVIINVGSLLGLQGGFGAVAYAASKAGVLGFTRALATETGPSGVRVNAVVPGYIETDMTKGALVNKVPLYAAGSIEASKIFMHIYSLTNIHAQTSTALNSFNEYPYDDSASPKKSPKPLFSSRKTSTRITA